MAVPCRLRLSTTTKSYETKTIFLSSRWVDLNGANLSSTAAETEILHGESNKKFATCLVDNPDIDHQAGSPESPQRYIVIGSSHTHTAVH